MPYYQQGPEDYYGPQSGFDAYSGRLNGGQLVMAFMNQLRAIKQRKQEEQWAIEDRELNKRVKEAQIKNYEETANPPKMSDKEWEYNLLQSDPEGHKRMFPEKYVTAQSTMEKSRDTEAGKLEARKAAGIDIKKTGSVGDSPDKVVKEYRLKRNEIESRYNKSLIDVEADHKKEVARIRTDKDVAPTTGTGPSAYQVAIGGALAAKKRAIEVIKAAKEDEIAKLDAAYEQYLPGLAVGREKHPAPHAPAQPAQAAPAPMAIAVPEKASKGDRRTIRRNGVVVEQVYNGTKWLDVK